MKRTNEQHRIKKNADIKLGNKFLKQVQEVQESHEIKTNVEIENEKMGPSETANEHFEKLLKNSEPVDVLEEYLHFRKTLPTLLNNQSSDIIDEVEKHLGVKAVMNKLPSHGIDIKRKGNKWPLLDALSFKTGKNYRNIIAPPTTKCILCGKYLIAGDNKQTQVALHTTSGPEMATKFSWECRKCNGSFKFGQKKTISSYDMKYHVDHYGNSTQGFKMYDEKYKVEVVRCSGEVFCTTELMKSYSSELQHCWTSAEGKSEAYNETHRDSEKTTYFQNFLKCKPEVGGHFRKKLKCNENDFDDETEPENSQMHELSRKSLSQGFFNYQVKEEMKEREVTEDFTFGPKVNPENSKETITYKQSIDDFMQEVDKLRTEELYSHKEIDCSIDCKKRGCGNVASVDGLWKLSYKICMWEPKTLYPEQDIAEYVPNVCPEAPAYGKAFCKVHSKNVEKQGFPSELRDFLEKCGANPKLYNKEGKSKVKEVLLELSSKSENNDDVTKTVEDVQGTKYLLRNRQIANKENFKTEQNENDCRKDIGEAPRLHRRSRGVEAVVSGGGIVEYWSPLFKSEGPTQVALIMLKYLQLKLEGKNVEDFSKFYLSYDNMCHVDTLKLLSDELSLPEPFDKVWLKINKIIDPLHIRNHKQAKCKENYNPEKVKQEIPEANFMCAEQTFCWLGRYKKIFNSMNKVHFHFMMHRLVKGRNSYTSYCYKNMRKPLLPSAKIVKID